MARPKRICSVAACNRFCFGHGWCQMHYQRWRRLRFHAPRRDALTRFAATIQFTDSCWLWRGYIDPKGYGRFYWNKREGRAHRFSYETFIGPIPDGLTIDHLCRVRHCVWPDHLEAVSSRINILRGAGISARNARKTHCKRGHPLSGGNLYVNSGSRFCRECLRDYKIARSGKRSTEPIQEQVI